MSRIPLKDLDARFIGAGGEGVWDAHGLPVPHREGVGLSFRCPCGAHDEYDRVFVAFTNPIDGGAPAAAANQPTWHRTGETIETMTLAPSIQRTTPGGCRWHGFVRNGHAESCG